MPLQLPPPTALALIVADTVLFDPALGKYFILGTYHRILAVGFPAVHGPIALYVALTNGHGDVHLTLSIVDVDEARGPVFQGGLTVRFHDPTDVIETSFRLPVKARFPEPGDYRVRLLAQDHLLIERRLILAHVTQPAS